MHPNWSSLRPRASIWQAKHIFSCSNADQKQSKAPAAATTGILFRGNYSSSAHEQHDHRNCRYEGSNVIVEENFSVNNVNNIGLLQSRILL
jgi:hypothetical protein